jgi:hypothetical protein
MADGNGTFKSLTEYLKSTLVEASHPTKNG